MRKLLKWPLEIYPHLYIKHTWMNYCQLRKFTPFPFTSQRKHAWTISFSKTGGAGWRMAYLGDCAPGLDKRECQSSRSSQGTHSRNATPTALPSWSPPKPIPCTLCCKTCSRWGSSGTDHHTDTRHISRPLDSNEMSFVDLYISGPWGQNRDKRIRSQCHQRARGFLLTCEGSKWLSGTTKSWGNRVFVFFSRIPVENWTVWSLRENIEFTQCY